MIAGLPDPGAKRGATEAGTERGLADSRDDLCSLVAYTATASDSPRPFSCACAAALSTSAVLAEVPFLRDLSTLFDHSFGRPTDTVPTHECRWIPMVRRDTLQ
jgi:hypothetical protein